MLKTKQIYLDFQASAPMCEAAILAMEPLLRTVCANPHSAQHALGWEANKVVESSRKKIAELISSSSDEVIFTSGATEANNLAIKGVATYPKSQRSRILVSAIEHKSVLASANFVEKYGYTVEKIPVDAEGYVDVDAYAALLGDDVLLVSIGLVNGEIGTVQNIAKLAEMARGVGSLFHTDAAQAPMHCDIDVYELGVDLLSLSSHKMAGPKGIGALYVAVDQQRSLQALLHGGGQESGLRSGTLPTFLCAGFGAAAQNLKHNAFTMRKDINSVRNEFWKLLNETSIDCILIGPQLNKRHVSNLSICFKNVNAEDILLRLQPMVAASTGSACNSGTHEPSHVLQEIGCVFSDAESVIRFSFGELVSKEDIENVIESLVKLIV